MKYLAKFEFGNYYHVFNRTNNKEKMFLNDSNRYFFLNRYNQFLGDYTETYAYCLLPNHFHLLVKVKSLDEIMDHCKLIPESQLLNIQKEFLSSDLNIEFAHDLIERQFSRLFISYSMGFNSMWNREGNFFYRPFKRKSIQSEFHLLGSILYIHHNPIHHNLSISYSGYNWSSYKTFLSSWPTLVKRRAVLDWFGGVAEFADWHQHYQDSRVDPFFH